MKNYERHWRSLRASGGERTAWALAFPSSATLVKLAVSWVGGDTNTAPSFSIDIFNSERGSRVSQSSGGNDPDGEYVGSPSLYRVCPTLNSDTPGELLHFFDESEGNYVNMDSGGSTTKKRMIYLEIEPEGGGDMTFDLALGCVTDVG